jgi:hypothetical protein
MVRHRLLFKLISSFLLTAMSVVSLQLGFTPQGNCSPARAALGACAASAQNGGDRVDLSGTSTTPGNGAPTKSGGTSTPTRANKQPAPANALIAPEPLDRFTVTGPLTLADLASFRPIAGTDHMEPNGWAVIGLNTNFYSTVGPEIVTGTLLNQPAMVRFTPLRWHWEYGDGSSATHRTGGGTWKSQRIEEFDATPTSHVFRARGTYHIDLTIDFAAEYEYGGSGWVPVDGTVAMPANRLIATAGDAKTVLVNRDCSQNPRGPGC